MRDEYGPEVWEKAVRGKFAERFPQKEVTVTLAPDVARFFPTDQAANDALRSLMRMYAELAAGLPAADAGDTSPHSKRA